MQECEELYSMIQHLSAQLVVIVIESSNQDEI